MPLDNTPVIEARDGLLQLAMTVQGMTDAEVAQQFTKAQINQLIEIGVRLSDTALQAYAMSEKST
jgi:hypothetical protein